MQRLSIRRSIGISLATLGAACGGCVWAHSIVETYRYWLPLIMMISGLVLWCAAAFVLLWPRLKAASFWWRVSLIAILVPTIYISWLIAGAISMLAGVFLALPFR